MSSFATNILQLVQTYQPASLGYLVNQCCFLNTANMEFENFQNKMGNLGSSVNLQLPYRTTVSEGLAPTWQSVVQRYSTLVCDQSANTAISTTNQQRIFNFDSSAEEFTTMLAQAAIIGLGNAMESNIGLNFVSGVTNRDPNSANYNTLNTFSGPYRFYGNGTTPLQSFQDLATMQMFFKNYGAVAQGGFKTYLPDYIIPSIIGSGLNQFAQSRNNEIADSWVVGTFGSPPVNYYQSNLLPEFTAGNLGQNGTILTLVSTNDATGQNVTQLTFSGAGTDAGAVLSGDMGQFLDNVSGQPNIRFLTFVNTANTPSVSPVQFRVTANAASSAGSVTLTITPALNWAGGQGKNITAPLAAGMQVKLLPSHRAGCVVGDNAFFVSMPELPDQSPFYSSGKRDATTGASITLCYGNVFDANQMGFKFMSVWGSVIIPEYSMRTIIPIFQ